MSSKYFHTWTAQNQSIDLDIDKSDGSYFIYQDKRILDFTSISFQANWGHSHEHLNNKIKEQMNTFSVTSARSKFPLKDRVTQNLIDLVGRDGKISILSQGLNQMKMP